MWSKVVLEETRVVLASEEDDYGIKARLVGDWVGWEEDDRGESGSRISSDAGRSLLPCELGSLDTDDIPVAGEKIKLKGGLKRTSSLGSRSNRNEGSKKRVRWADQAEGCEGDSRGRSIASGKKLAVAALLVLLLAYGSMRSEIATPVTSKLRAHFERATGEPHLAFLRFHYQQVKAGGRRGGAGAEQMLRLDEQRNVVFSSGGLTASGEADAFEIQDSSILLQRAGLYLFIIHYEHAHSNVTINARLPFEGGELRSFLLHGSRNSLYRHCIIHRPQNISVAVYSGLPDRAQHVNFRSLLLEVTRLGHDLPQPLHQPSSLPA